jgi:hypothetical protein
MEAIGFILFLIGGMIVFSFVTAIVLINKNSNLKHALNLLERRVNELEGRPPKPKEEKLPVEVVEEVPQEIPEPEPTPVEPVEEEIKEEPPPPPVSVPFKAPEPAPVTSTQKSEYWSRIEKQFIDNWTGILGSVIIVMGAAFLSIYAALKMAPFYRFVMLTGFAGALFTIFFVLRAKSKWLKLAVWMRSSGCAIFLFGCLGSGGIPGLQWIESLTAALGLLLLGVAVNLFVGTISGSQFFTSFHSILSLAALAIAPQSQITMGIALAITLIQVFMTYRHRWEYHLLVTIAVFLAYHLYWAYSLDLFTLSPMPLNLRLTGIAATVFAGVTTAFVHYRKIYGSQTFERLPFIVHLFNWCCMGIGFILYSTGSKVSTIVLMAAALAVFFLARRAKKLEIRWLFVTDTLISQSLALIAVSTTQRWGIAGVPFSGILMLEVMVFLVAMLREQEKIIRWIGVFLFHLSGLMLLVAGGETVLTRELGSLPTDTFIVAAALVFYSAVHLYMIRRESEAFDSFRMYGMGDISEKTSISGILIGLLGLELFALVYDFQWSPYAFAAIITAFLLLRRRFQLKGLEIGTLVLTAGTYLLGWHHLRGNLSGDITASAIYGLPFLLIAVIGTRIPLGELIEKHRQKLWIYLFSIHLALYSLTVLNPLSPLIPGTLWLLLAPVYLEAAQFLYRRFGPAVRENGLPHRYLLHWGYIFMGLFIVRHLWVHIQTPIHIGGINVRLLQALLALAVFVYWAMARKPDDHPSYKSWKYLHPLMWELAIVFSVMTVGLEAPDDWYPIAWVGGAYLLLFLGGIAHKQLSRFRFYSLLFYWAAAFHIAFISSTDNAPEQLFTRQTWFAGLVALLLQMGFVVYFYRKAALDKVNFPLPVSFFQGWLDRIQRRRNLWIYYPYFIAVALFLYWTFSHSLLTLLWVVETFVIFTISLVLRESHFRYAAMAGLGGCLFRLIFYDLSRSGTITRALVFLGVGSIMIVMNSLYNKYRERYQDD